LTQHLTPQMPAEGILVHRDFGDSKFYAILCECGNESDTITMEVEADESNVSINLWTKVKTDWWNKAWRERYDIENPILQKVHWSVVDLLNGVWHRIKLTHSIWVKGYYEMESWTVLTRQQAINLSNVLVTATDDVVKFREEFKAKQALKEKNNENTVPGQ
jgi:hypothetical protein